MSKGTDVQKPRTLANPADPETFLLAAMSNRLPGVRKVHVQRPPVLNYHGTYEPPLCHAQARALFNTMR